MAMQEKFKSFIGVIFVFLVITSCSCVEKEFPSGTLIPRNVLFANPERFKVTISHNGKFLSYLTRSKRGLELIIESIETRERIRSFAVKDSGGSCLYNWCFTNKHILLPEDNNGDENYQISCIDIENGTLKNITPFKKSSTSYVSKISPYFPEEVIIFNNERTGRWFDFYRIDITTGKCEKIFENNEYQSVLFDRKFKLKILQKVLSNGDIDVLTPDKKVILRIPSKESLFSGVFGVEHDDFVYAYSSVDQDKRSLIKIDIKTKKIEKILNSDKADVNIASLNPQTQDPQIAEIYYLKKELIPLTESVADELKSLREKFENRQFSVLSRCFDDSKWLIFEEESDKPFNYYLFDTRDRSIRFLFSSRNDLKKYHLQRKEPVVIKSRDGLDLVCYLTRASGSKIGETTPLVAYIHGGPPIRDKYPFEPEVQWLANRGYSVLQINYRGSSGFGKNFRNAINKNLEGMHNDIIDAVNWAIDQGIADKSKIAIMGASWGGYSTLAGLAFTPDLFCCGVDAVGPSNFITMLSSVPEYWRPTMSYFYNMLGNPDIATDVPYLKSVSPFFSKEKIKKPLLVFHGKNDPRVNQKESDQIVSALKEQKTPVAYVLYPDEGHGFIRESNQKSYIALSEKFLSKFLGGRFESIKKGEFEGSSHQILEGKEILEVNEGSKE